MSETEGWQGDYGITLSPKEVEWFHAFARTRVRRSTGRSAWLLTAGSVAAGFGLALLLVLNGTVRAERAGVVVVGGFLAFWLGVRAHALDASRAARRERTEGWGAIGGRFTVVLNDAGLSWGIAGRSTRTEWWLMARAEDLGGSVLLWTVWRSVLYLPARSLLADWPAARLVPRLNAHIQRSRVEKGLQPGEGVITPP